MPLDKEYISKVLQGKDTSLQRKWYHNIYGGVRSNIDREEQYRLLITDVGERASMKELAQAKYNSALRAVFKKLLEQKFVSSTDNWKLLKQENVREECAYLKSADTLTNIGASTSEIREEEKRAEDAILVPIARLGVGTILGLRLDTRGCPLCLCFGSTPQASLPVLPDLLADVVRIEIRSPHRAFVEPYWFKVLDEWLHCARLLSSVRKEYNIGVSRITNHLPSWIDTEIVDRFGLLPTKELCWKNITDMKLRAHIEPRVQALNTHKNQGYRPIALLRLSHNHRFALHISAGGFDGQTIHTTVIVFSKRYLEKRRLLNEKNRYS